MDLKQSYQNVHRVALKLENQKSYGWIEVVSLTIKHLNICLKNLKQKLYSTYSDLKAVFIERFNKTLLHIINKPMFINGDGNRVNILNDAP